MQGSVCSNADRSLEGVAFGHDKKSAGRPRTDAAVAKREMSVKQVMITFTLKTLSERTGNVLPQVTDPAPSRG